MRPRAVNPDGSLKAADDWVLSETCVKRGAALGANSTIRCGITIGEWAMIGSGSVVTRDVPNHGLVYGNPARLHGFVCACGEITVKDSQNDHAVTVKCPTCGRLTEIPLQDWEKLK
jgi:carbonic anhydrase/acetyltransferase-like protein (isoleucine patch superfamily)